MSIGYQMGTHKIKFYSKDFLRKSGIVDKIKKIVR